MQRVGERRVLLEEEVGGAARMMCSRTHHANSRRPLFVFSFLLPLDRTEAFLLASSSYQLPGTRYQAGDVQLRLLITFAKKWKIQYYKVLYFVFTQNPWI